MDQIKLPAIIVVCIKQMDLLKNTIKEKEFFKNMLKTISTFASTINRIIELSELHRNKKCKLRKYQHTRFTSSFLMLYSVLVAYKRNVF